MRLCEGKDLLTPRRYPMVGVIGALRYYWDEENAMIQRIGKTRIPRSDPKVHSRPWPSLNNDGYVFNHEHPSFRDAVKCLFTPVGPPVPNVIEA